MVIPSAVPLLCASILLLLCSVSMGELESYHVYTRQQLNSLPQQWKQVVEESDQNNLDVAKYELPIVSIPASEELAGRPRRTKQATGQLPMLTGTLLAWITTQTENMVEELEAIARDNANSNKLSIVNYVRYLSMNNELAVIARQDIDELNWVKKKHDIFASVYESAENVVATWLQNRETELNKEEQAELERDRHPLTRGDGTPSEKWVRLYEDIKYIVNQGSLSDWLTIMALKMLDKSPLGEDHQRNMRYLALSRPVN